MSDMLFQRQYSDFYRPMLKETTEKIIAPEVYVQDWYYELLGLKESTEGQFGSPLSEAEDFYSLLVHYGHFLRILPEFLDSNINQLMGWAKNEFDRLRQEDFQMALEIFQPDQWLTDANRIAEAWKDDLLDEEEARSQTLILLTDYDDIRLCIEMAWKKWGEDPLIEKYSDAVIPCDRWVEDDEYLVELTSLWYQTSASMLNEESSIEHPITLDHFRAQLDKLEERWKYSHAPIVPEEMQVTDNKVIASVASPVLHQSLAVYMGITVAAAEGNQKLPELRTITWLHPEGNDSAIMAWYIPTSKTTEYILTVILPGSRGDQLDSQYASRKVRLGETLEKRLDGNGRVVFQYNEMAALVQQSPRLNLYVENRNGEMLQWNEIEDKNAD